MSEQTITTSPAELASARKRGFRSACIFMALGVLLVVVLPLLFTSRYSTNLLILASGMGIATLGLVVVLGYAGQISIAQAAFYGIGAYAIALGTTQLGLKLVGRPVARFRRRRLRGMPAGGHHLETGRPLPGDDDDLLSDHFYPDHHQLDGSDGRPRRNHRNPPHTLLHSVEYTSALRVVRPHHPPPGSRSGVATAQTPPWAVPWWRFAKTNSRRKPWGSTRIASR